MGRNIYQMEKAEVLSFLNVELETGLTNVEVLKRRIEHGENELEKPKKVSFFVKLLNQFKDFMIIILIIAALISILLAKEYANGLLILMIVVVNALIGAGQEEKAEKSLDKIKELSSPLITVLRDSLEILIDVRDIVVGDIVLLHAGDFIPADVRIIESINLKIDESVLTGESVPVIKTSQVILKNDVSLGDLTNLAFMGTLVTYGRGKAVVVNIGMQTEMGKIAKMLTTTKKDLTPLQKSISQLGKILALIALIIVSVIFIIEIIQGLYSNWNLGFILAFKKINWMDSFLFAVSLAVAAIPEGLPAIITIVLALGMQNLVKQRAIMKSLPAVETLGSTEIICSDKTGTLTKNIMTVKEIYLNDETLNVFEIKEISSSLKDFITYCVLVNDAKIRTEKKEIIKIGDPTELALIDFAIKLNVDPLDITNKYPRIYELPFDSKRKLMTTVHLIENQRYAVVKGAPEILIKRATSYLKHGEIFADTVGLKNFYDADEKMTNNALRVLAIGIKKITGEVPLGDLSFEALENNLTLVGLVGIIDPPRPEVKAAIETAKKAGIKTIMITGDHKNTATKIASELKILNAGDIAITGQELDLMSDYEFKEKLSKITVYARVSPENKVRIVKTLQDSNKVVAMTGDGVNDAPSLKQADIGISMGKTGSEVTKSAADMILTDDNFSTIVESVSTGRTIFSNIKKVLHFLLSCNVGEILAMFLGVTIGVLLFSNTTSNHILLPAQILWVNLVTDSFLAIALGMEPKEKDVMDKKPRDSKKSIFKGGLGLKIFYQGLLIGILTFIAYLIGYYIAGEITAQTMAFMVLSLSQLTHALNARNETVSIFKLKISKPLIIALIISFSLQMLVYLPFLRGLFNITSLSALNWLIVIGLSLMPLIIVEIQKFFYNKTTTKQP